MTLPTLNIQDHIQIVIVSPDTQFEKHCDHILQSLLNKKDQKNIIKHEKLATVFLEKSERGAYLFIVEVTDPNLEIYLEFIKKLRSQGFSCIYMFVLPQTD